MAAAASAAAGAGATHGGGRDNVLVAVRVRPFNQRELDLKTPRVIRMQGKSTFIKNPADGAEKEFAFDYSYDSFDSASSAFASQETVYRDLGTLYLDNALRGFNCSLFAYGQTGSGKSFSMMGADKPALRGIIPRGCEELFTRIGTLSSPTLRFEVEVSFLEIYREKINDLLNPTAKDLEVREDRMLGVFVQNLKKVYVKSYAEIQSLMEAGNKVRTVAATKMNATSSRSHSVFTVYLKQIETPAGGKPTTRQSKISLIDLAGSERQDKTGAEGDRLQEGASINLSLTTLGSVINALSEGKPYVPYRNSVLTRILQESLGGNAKTIMIAAVSPAGDNYDESLSTLRYAERAKKIVNKAQVNETSSDKLVKDLQAQIDELKKQLAAKTAGGSATDAGAAAQREQLAARLAESERLRKELEMSAQQKEAEAEKLKQQRQAALADMGVTMGELDALADSQLPRLVNMNPDPALSGVLVYFLRNGTTTFGAAAASDVVLGGVGIAQNHATITVAGSTVTLTPVGADGKTYVSGKQVTGPVQLQQGDRVIMGQNFLFRFADPKRGEMPPCDWETAMSEFAQARGKPVGSASPLVKATETADTVNDMAEAMHKPITVVVDISNDGKNTISYKVKNARTQQTVVWSAAEMEDRLAAMQEAYVQWQAHPDAVLPHDQDPFYVQPQPVLIGRASVPLAPLLSTGDVNGEFALTGGVGKDTVLSFRLCAYPKTGRGTAPAAVSAPGAYLFQVVVVQARNVPVAACANVFAKYDFPVGGDLESTCRAAGAGRTALINFTLEFSMDVTADMRKQWSTTSVPLELWGHPLETDVHAVQEELFALSDKIAAQEVRLAEAEARLAATAAAKHAAADAAEKSKQEAAALQAEVTALKATIASSQAEMAMLKADAATHKAAAAAAQGELARLKEDLTAAHTALAASQQAAATAQEEAKQLKGKLAAAEALSASLKSENESLKKGVQADEAALRAENTQLKTELAALKAVSEQTAAELKEAKSQLHKHESERRETHKHLEEMRKDTAELKTELSAAKSQAKSSHETNVKLSSEVEALRKELAELRKSGPAESASAHELADMRIENAKLRAELAEIEAKRRAKKAADHKLKEENERLKTELAAKTLKTSPPVASQQKSRSCTML